MILFIIILFIVIFFMLYHSYIIHSQDNLEQKSKTPEVTNVICSTNEIQPTKENNPKQTTNHWLDKSKILPCGFMMAAICCMFPPYYAPFKNGTAIALGNQFILNTPYYYSGHSSIKGVIDIPTLAVELAIILFITAAIYFYVNRKNR